MSDERVDGIVDLLGGEEAAVPELAEGETVRLRIRGTVYVDVTRVGVTAVRILPGERLMIDEGDGTAEAARAARRWAIDNEWAPLADLPDSVIWEG